MLRCYFLLTFFYCSDRIGIDCVLWAFSALRSHVPPTSRLFPLSLAAGSLLCFVVLLGVGLTGVSYVVFCVVVISINAAEILIDGDGSLSEMLDTVDA